jgi:hypothetical protein
MSTTNAVVSLMLVNARPHKQMMKIATDTAFVDTAYVY